MLKNEKYKILIIEENQKFLESINNHSHEIEYSNIEFINSKKDLLNLNDFKKYNLIFTITKLDDFDIIKYFQENNYFNSCYIIVLSETNNDENAVKIMKFGALDFIVKDEYVTQNFDKIIKRGLRDVSIRIEKQNAIDALKESEEKFRQLVEKSNDIPFVINKHGTITYIGPQISNYGFKLYQIIGKYFWDIVIDDDKEFVIESFKKAIDKFDNPKIVFRVNTPSNGIIWVEENSRYFFDNENELIIASGILRDISERIKVQNELEENQQKYKTLFEAANDAIFIMDGYKFIECNQKTLDIFECNDYDDILEHTPDKFSPKKQPNGKNSKKAAIEFINEAYKGKPQRFFWIHKNLKGDNFEAEVSLNRFKFKNKFYLQAIVRKVKI